MSEPTPPKMKAFLEHMQTCQTCKEHDNILSLCNAGNAFYGAWTTEARIRFQECEPETDPQRIMLAIRYFGKNSPDGLILPQATALALNRHIEKMTKEMLDLAGKECLHSGESKCEVCGALCAICDTSESGLAYDRVARS